MKEFFDSVKDNIGKAADGVGKYSRIAAQKASGIVDRTKYGFAANDAESKIAELMTQIGEYVYEEYRGGAEFPEAVAEKLAQIDTLREEVAEIKDKIAELKEKALCPECGEYNDRENVYCAKCGAKMENE